MNKSIIRSLAEEYNQLYISPGQGVSKSEVYKSIVLKGITPIDIINSDIPGFTGSEYDRIFIESTPAGDVKIIYIYQRTDFERFIQIMMYKCENMYIPKNMGAATISGIPNWRKIEKHKEEFLKSGGILSDWRFEFSEFVKNKDNYTDTLLVLSSGEYSGTSAEESGFSKDEWIKLSFEIRKYHECTHFICRHLYPEKINVLFDEIVADCMGLVFAVGRYDTELAKKFLGISDNEYKQGGRLENYIEKEELISEKSFQANRIIHNLSEFIDNSSGNGYSLLCEIEENMEKLLY